MKIRKGIKYRFNPVPLDRFMPYHDIEQGEHVRVGCVPGIPSARTVNAGHVHVYHADGSHAGFVHVNSLENIRKVPAPVECPMRLTVRSQI